MSMFGWLFAALCALIAMWVLSRASYWKWMWEGERSLNQGLLATGRTHAPGSTRLLVESIHDDTERPPGIDSRKTS